MKLKNLKKLIVLLFISILILFSNSCVFANTEAPELVSQAAILLDYKTGKVLYKKNSTEKMYPASTTKIMTAILTLENCSLDEVVTVSYDTAMSIPEGYSSANLQIGEQLTVAQLLQLLLVHSANDAANCLAEHIGGSVESFVSMMNTKLNELGITSTHFTSAFGMHNDEHYTTAQDLATIMKYCMKNETFRKLAGSASCAIPATNKYGPRKYVSTNELIIPNSSNYYSYLTTGKTGYTSQAGDCLVSCAYKDDLELICVVLGGKTVNGVSTRFSETKALYDFAYSNYSMQNVLAQNDIVTQIEVKRGTRDTKNLDLLAKNSVLVLLKNTVSKDSLDFEINLNEKIKAPVVEGDTLGSVTYKVDDIEYKTDLIASHNVEKSRLLEILIELWIGILILFLVYKIFFHRKKEKYRYINYKGRY